MGRISDGWLQGHGWFASPRILLSDPRLLPTDRLIGFYLCGIAGMMGDVFPPREVMARELHLGMATVVRGLKRLEDYGWLVRDTKVDMKIEGRGRPRNHYRLSLPPTITPSAWDAERFSYHFDGKIPDEAADFRITEQNPSIEGKDRKREIEKRPRHPAQMPVLLDPKQAVWFQALWNRVCTRLGKVKEMSPERQQALAQRLAEHPQPEFWEQVLAKLNASSFATGQNRRGWRADVDWVLRDGTNAVKVLEGRYDGNGKMYGQAAPSSAEEHGVPEGWEGAEVDLGTGELIHPETGERRARHR